MVKIHGVKVDLGGIETLLSQHPGVGAAAVVRRDVNEVHRVEAFVVPKHAASLTAGQLRRYLAARVPTAWIPAEITLKSDLPATRNGKIDTTALRAGDAGREVPLRYSRLALDAADVAVVQTCGEVLDGVSVDLESDFFSLGGDSLTAARLVATINRKMDVKLTVRDVFFADTLGEIAERIRGQNANVAGRKQEATSDDI
jgi:acyl carrier protein